MKLGWLCGGQSHITVKPDNNSALWPTFMPTRHTIISHNRLGARKLSKHFVSAAGVSSGWGYRWLFGGLMAWCFDSLVAKI